MKWFCGVIYNGRSGEHSGSNKIKKAKGRERERGWRRDQSTTNSREEEKGLVKGRRRTGVGGSGLPGQVSSEVRHSPVAHSLSSTPESLC